MQKLKPALQYSEGRSKPWSGARLVNCFSEKADGDKRDDFAVMATPGLVLFANISTYPIRGTHTMGGVLYAVVGTSLYSVNSAGVASSLGSVPGVDLVRMADNGTELAIAAENIGYVYSGGSVQIPAVLPAVLDVVYFDSYFVWALVGVGQFIISAPNDGLTYDILDVATVEGAPDGLVGIVNDHRELHLYGTETIEIWYNSGAADFPFERQGNAFIERGCFDRDSLVKVDNSVHFCGDDRIIYRLEGYSPVRVSTHSIEYQLRAATYVRAFTYTQEGHKFYCLASDAGTFCYDMATGTWHQRQSWAMDNWRVGGADSAYSQTILSDAFTGKLYTPDLDAYDENGETISVTIEPPTIESGDGIRRTMYELELLCETGVGLNSGQGSDPQVMLTYSDDGGRNWSNEMWRSMGAIGEYTTRPTWGPLGDFVQRQLRFVFTDPVRKMVLGYRADVR
jgi:hypothetical protein